MTFTIDTDNNITAFRTKAEAAALPSTSLVLVASTKEEFADAIAEGGATPAGWTMSQLAELWNSFAGTPGFDKLKAVKKFENRAKAIARIWSAIQVLAPAQEAAPATETPVDAPAQPEPTTKAARRKKTPKAPRAAKKAAPAEAKPVRAGTKKDDVIKMLKRKNGASNAEIQAVTEWQRHTVRGFIAGTLKKAGIVAESFKRTNGDHAYRIAE